MLELVSLRCRRKFTRLRRKLELVGAEENLTVNNKDNRVFMSRTIGLIVALMPLGNLREASRTNMHANFKNIKFPRGNYQTDSSETSTLYCLC